MKFHKVDISELADFTFEQIICSDSNTKKRLVVYVNPIEERMHFKLYVNGEVVGRYNSLDVALLDYNKIQR